MSVEHVDAAFHDVRIGEASLMTEQTVRPTGLGRKSEIAAFFTPQELDQTRMNPAKRADLVEPSDLSDQP